MPTTPTKSSRSAKTTKNSKSASPKSTTKSSTKSDSKTSPKASKPATKASKTTNAPGDITNWASALKWLMSHTDYERMRIVPYNERTFSLSRMARLLEVLGNPHHEIRCVQVAGTKGKGSTCAMLASMLEACGYTTGLYTSPHLIDIRERIAINGSIIPHADLTEIFRQIASHQAKIEDKDGRGATFFEIMTAAAVRYFADQAVDIAILETGLGGRLDATTAVDPLVCGITAISHDHMNVLGRDITSIAREKAGIFKKDVPAISVEQTSEVAAVLDEVAEEKGTPLEYTNRQIEFSYRFEANRELGPHTRVSITTASSRWEHLAVPLRGEHQAHNCGLALALLDKLKAHGFSAPEDRVIEGLNRTNLPGRMEQVWDEPRVLVDGAHNAASIQALIRSLGAHISYDSLVLVFGCGQDKDVTGMLKQIALGADKVIFTQAKGNPRACEPPELISKFSELSGKMAQTAPTLKDALKLAGRAVSREDLIVVTGSFYLAGEAKKYFADSASKKKKKSA